MLSTDDKVFLLAKVFCERRFAEQFLQGKLYANRLSKFKCIEEDLARGYGEPQSLDHEVGKTWCI